MGPDTRSPRPPQRTVVVADASSTMRRIVTSVLTREGWTVVDAADGVAAVQAVFAHQPDAVVMDTAMPRLSGFAAARLLHEDWATADIPVVLLSGLGSASDRYWGARAGAAYQLSRDFEVPALAAAVRDAAAASRPHRPDPQQLSADEVLERACEALDHALFRATVAAEVTALAARVTGVEATVAALLGVVGSVADHALAGVVLIAERVALVAVSRPVSQAHLRDFLLRGAEAITSSTGVQLVARDLAARLADPHALLGTDEEAHLTAFLSMPLHGHDGRPVGILALSSDEDVTFPESSLRSLRALEGAAALVVDHARTADARRAMPR